MCSWKMRRHRHFKFLAVFVAFTMMLTLGFASKNVRAATGLSGYATMEGYNVDSKDWEGSYVTGNLGKTYAEGEWFPGRIRLNGFQSVYPNFAGFPDINIWYDAAYATNSGYGMFVDLVKGIQIGVRTLGDDEGWPMPNGLPYPMGTAERVDDAQNHSGENQWIGYELLELPDIQMNRSAVTATLGGVGSIYDGQRMFTIKTTDIITALNALNVPLTTNNIEIYFEFHLARTTIWGSRNLQTEYASGAPARWGGYLYSGQGLNFNPIAFGSGPKTGSSGHFGLLDSSKTVPLPDTPEVYRTVTGMKFLDVNNNGDFDIGEPGLEGWKINLVGYIEDIEVLLTTTTGPGGIYTFSGLSYGSELRVHEEMEPGYTQTYPHSVITLANGAESFMKVEAGKGPWRWYIDRSLMPDNANDAVTISGIDFGNFLPDPKIEIKKTGDELSKIGDEIEFTVEVKNTGNVDLDLTSIVDDKFGDLSYIKWGADGFGATLAKGATESHTFKMVIPNDAADPFVNKVTAVYNYMQIEAKGDSSHETNLFQPLSSIEKTVDKIYAIPGETVRYKIEVKNLSSEDTPVMHYVLEDDLLGWSISGGTAKMFDLGFEESKIFEGTETDYMIPLAAERYSIVKNTAAIHTSFDDFDNKYDYSSYAETKVLWPGLEIKKSGDELSKIGDEVLYKFDIKNTGDVDLSLEKVYDETFKFDLTSLFGKTVLKPGETDHAEKKFTIPADAKDPFKNKVTATYKYIMGDFSKTVEESAEFELNLFQPGIEIEKTADKTVSMVGDTVKYKIIVKNTSSADSPDLKYSVVDDVYGTVVTDALISSGDSKEYTYDYKVKETDPNPLINTAKVTASPVGFPNVLEDKDSHEVKLFTPGLTIKKTADTEISKVGDTINYKIVVKNTTAEAYAPKIHCVLTDALLGLNMNFDLASGEEKIVNVAYVVKASDDPEYLTKFGWTELKNTAKVVGSPIGFEAISEFKLEDSVTVDLVHPHIDIDKSVNTAFAHVGDTVTYTIKITNTGDIALHNIVVKDSMLGTLSAFVTSLAVGAHDTHTYDRLLTIADVGILTNTATVTSNPVGLPNKIEDKDDAVVEVKPRLYDETGWAYGGPYANPIMDIEGVTSTNWGWTNGPLPEGDYRWPIYVGAGQNDLNKGEIVGELIVSFHDGTMKITYKMDAGFSLKEIHLYVGKDPLPTKERGKTTVVVDSPGLFPINPKDVDGKTEWSVTIDKLKAPVYVAAHCVVWVPWQEMNKIYNATTY